MVWEVEKVTLPIDRYTCRLLEGSGVKSEDVVSVCSLLSPPPPLSPPQPPLPLSPPPPNMHPHPTWHSSSRSSYDNIHFPPNGVSQDGAHVFTARWSLEPEILWTATDLRTDSLGWRQLFREENLIVVSSQRRLKIETSLGQAKRKDWKQKQAKYWSHRIDKRSVTPVFVCVLLSST